MTQARTEASRLGYEHSAAYDSGFLPVGDIHKLWYEQYGQQGGKPVIFLHGGPGGKTTIQNTAFFNPAVYRVVLLDQRGCGKSTPPADLRENTSHHLVSDIEALRKHLQIPKWHLVFGGSWGSCLSLLYAQTHPEAVGSLVIRGIFTVRKAELAWFYEGGISQFFPQQYDAFINFLPEDKRSDAMSAYYALMTSEDKATRLSAARSWSEMELCTSNLFIDQEGLKKLDDEVWVLAHSRIEAHYFKHGAWIEDGQLLKTENIDKIRHIPTTIVQGRYDMVCTPRTAYDLHKAWPESTLIWIPDAGHSAEEPGTKKTLIEICDQYAEL
ncbi:proline iminopeptidase [Rhizodiscina lignyota]|uniref:Proline iminopeptidase n=1 Tax=Rhizodiscina lignyota TaxID=1504668 RepID=A0A9P4M6V2_9PEZI|nr:proline iminopeptidase [Rhizodiscina lignyota]